jgi:hypothetical protein
MMTALFTPERPSGKCPPRGLLTQGQLRNPDNPDHILENADVDKIRSSARHIAANQHVVFLSACMSTSDRIHGELLLKSKMESKPGNHRDVM